MFYQVFLNVVFFGKMERLGLYAFLQVSLNRCCFSWNLAVCHLGIHQNDISWAGKVMFLANGNMLDRWAWKGNWGKWGMVVPMGQVGVGGARNCLFGGVRGS